MRKLNLRVMAGLVGMLSLTAVCGHVTAFAADSGFSDIEGHWAEATIIKWKDEGIISGYTDGTFKPDKYVTRAELAKILTKAFDLKEEFDLSIDLQTAKDTIKNFKYNDIDSNSWYYPYLKCSAKYIPIYPLPVDEGSVNNIPYESNIATQNLETGFLPEINALRVHFAEALVEIKKEKDNLTIVLPQFSEILSSTRESYNDLDDGFFVSDGHGGVLRNAERMYNYIWLAKELDIMQGNDKGEFLPYNNVSRAEVLTVIDRMLTES